MPVYKALITAVFNTPHMLYTGCSGIIGTSYVCLLLSMLTLQPPPAFHLSPTRCITHTAPADILLLPACSIPLQMVLHLCSTCCNLHTVHIVANPSPFHTTTDGLVSTASLMLGVGAGADGLKAMQLAGVAGLVAGALSMAAGEYISVSSQKDAEEADIEKVCVCLGGGGPSGSPTPVCTAGVTH
eukprot:GHUV01040460.1.p1 GENE.GHUV01040460.1~~GHUV01040460.1.p1  ORF type:complete len:185 (+),score=33.94 GHUV01040460.1:83-637(+)